MGKAEAKGVVTAGWSKEAGESGGRDGGRWAKKNLSSIFLLCHECHRDEISLPANSGKWAEGRFPDGGE